jgi:hypothetical protein
MDARLRTVGRVRLKPLEDESEIQDDLYLKVFSVHIEN